MRASLAVFLRLGFLAALVGSLATFSFFALGVFSFDAFSLGAFFVYSRASAASFWALSSLRFTTFRAITPCRPSDGKETGFHAGCAGSHWGIPPADQYSVCRRHRTGTLHVYWTRS